MSEPGVKYDTGKPLPDLVLGDFMIALEQAVFAGTFGAFKYEPKNFQKLENGEQRYAEAALRHYMARKKGDEFDSESGELHDAHELWCHIARLYFKLRDDKRVFQKAVTRKSTGQYYHPFPDQFGNPWSDEPFWFNEADARQVVWALAKEEKGELDILVKVREIQPVTITQIQPGDRVTAHPPRWVVYNYDTNKYWSADGWTSDIEQAWEYEEKTEAVLYTFQEYGNIGFVNRVTIDVRTD